MKLGDWPKFQKWHIYSPSKRRAQNWVHSHSMDRCFWDIWAWSPEVAHILFLTQRVATELIFFLRALVSEIWVNFLTCYIWIWNLAVGQSARSCIYTLFLPQGVEIGVIFALRAVIFDIAPIFKIAIFGHETWPLAKEPKGTHIPYFYPKMLKLSLF